MRTSLTLLGCKTSRESRRFKPPLWNGVITKFWLTLHNRFCLSKTLKIENQQCSVERVGARGFTMRHFRIGPPHFSPFEGKIFSIISKSSQHKWKAQPVFVYLLWFRIEKYRRYNIYTLYFFGSHILLVSMWYQNYTVVNPEEIRQEENCAWTLT